MPVMIITGSIAWAVNSQWLYTSGFQKYAVADVLAQNGLPVTRTDLRQIAGGFVHYFNSGDEYIHLTVQSAGRTVELFNEEEIIHFKDVKGLFRLDYGALLGTFLFGAAFAAVALFRKQRRLLARTLVIGGGVTLGLMALLGIGIAFDFNSLFYQFHLISFSNTFWSAEGNMLLLFPGGFWYDAALYVTLFAVGLALLLGGAGAAYLVTHKSEARNPKFETNPKSE